MSFTLDAAQELGIPDLLLWTPSACGFLAYCHFQRLIEKGFTPFKGDVSDLPLVRNLSSSLEDEMEKNDDVEGKSEFNNEKNDESEGEDKFWDASDLPLVRNLSSSLEDEMEKNDDAEKKNEFNNEKNDESEGEDKFDDSTDAIIDSKASDAIPVSEDTDDLAQEGYEIENLEEEMVVEKSIEVLGKDVGGNDDCLNI